MKTSALKNCALKPCALKIIAWVTLLLAMASPVHAQRFNTDALLNDMLFSGVNENKFVAELKLQASVRAGQIAAVCEFDEEQKRQLSEAVEGDIVRLRRDIISLRQRARDLPAHLELMQQQTEVQKLAATFKQATAAEAWLDRSLFYRAAHSIANPMQLAKLNEFLDQLQSDYDRAVVLQTVVTVEQTMLMTDKQRDWLVKQLMAVQLSSSPKTTRHAIGFQKLAELKTETLQEVFSDEEIKKLTTIQAAVVRPGS